MPGVKIHAARLPGVFVVDLRDHQDRRGSFYKVFNEASFHSKSMPFTLKESYISTSHRGVLRGMHFQSPPHDCIKIVHAVAGRVLDVVLDLRVGSPTYGQTFEVELDANRPSAIYIPTGLAHGFYALEDHSKLLYLQSAMYAPAHDTGILWNSFDYPWPSVNGVGPTLSDRDLQLHPFKQYSSPFTF